jgi:hypothetical protein
MGCELRVWLLQCSKIVPRRRSIASQLSLSARVQLLLLTMMMVVYSCLSKRTPLSA